MNTRIILQLTGLLFSAWGSWHFGYWLSHPTATENQSIPKTPQETLVSNPTRASSTNPKSLHQPPPSDTSGTTPDSPSHSVNDGQYQSLVGSHHLENRDRVLSAVFSKTELGQAFAHISTLYSVGLMRPDSGPQVSLEKQYLREQLRLLQTQAGGAIIELQQSMPNLGSGFSQERQFLVQFATTLDVDSSTKLGFLSSELIRSVGIPPANPQDPAIFNGVVALKAMMRLSEDSNSIEPSLRQALTQLTQNSDKMRLLSTYSNKFPNQAQKLKDELNL